MKKHIVLTLLAFKQPVIIWIDSLTHMYQNELGTIVKMTDSDSCYVKETMEEILFKVSVA